jgi:hypothetical protein
MPRVKYTGPKGLFQDSGSGIQFNISGTSTAAPTGALIGAASGVDPYSQGTTQLFPLGTKLVYGDRTFRYAFMNGAVTAGKLLQQAPHIANHINCLVIDADAATLVGVGGSTAYSHAAGSRAICIDTSGDTDITADQYAEGYLQVNDAQGEGQLLKIRTHLAHEHGADPSIVIQTYDPLATAIVKNASQCSLLLNPYKDIIVAPTAETGAIIGATVIDMSDDNYGWVVTSGPASLLVSEAVVVLGHRVVRSDADAGGVMAADSDPLLYPVGQCMAGGVVDTEYCMVWLNIE